MPRLTSLSCGAGRGCRRRGELAHDPAGPGAQPGEHGPAGAARGSPCNAVAVRLGDRVADRLLGFDDREIRERDGGSCRSREEGAVTSAMHYSLATTFPDCSRPSGRRSSPQRISTASPTLDRRFPDDTDECPYCHQALDDSSRELLQKYKTYLVDDSQATLRTARQSLATLVSAVVDMTVPAEPAANGNGGRRRWTSHCCRHPRPDVGASSAATAVGAATLGHRR